MLISLYLVTARSETGDNGRSEIMALAVPGRPAWGVQFHPESVLSPAGRVLLGNWLRAVEGFAALRGDG